MSIQKIVLVTANYPSIARPTSGTFVKELAHAFARLDEHCTVIRPITIFDRLHAVLPAFCTTETEPGHNPITVLSPKYISFSNKKILKYNSFMFTQLSFEEAVFRAYRQIKQQPDAIYGHFLYSGGAAAMKLGRKYKVPAFTAVGEGVFWTVEPLGFYRAQRDFQDVCGVVAVSTLLKRKITDQIKIPAQKIEVFPNGVDTQQFYPRAKLAMRAKLNFPQDLFIVVFIGAFDQNKGVMRVTEALKDIPDIGLILIGSGENNPVSSNILFKGCVSHALIPEYLSAADVFVLPTGHEGSSNAIVEAMACGLPVVSSQGEFNDDILNGDVSLRVDSQDIAAIRSTVCQLKDNADLRARMSKNALAWAGKFDINLRARRILNWMNKSQNENMQNH